MGIEKKDPANFSPSVEIPAKVDSFRFWCQKVLPLVYDDSLSYYELLCKVVNYLNNTIADVNTLGTDVNNLNNAYNELQSYVNDYFSTLDVQNEINNKLDTMAQDGTLSTLIQPLFDTYKTEINNEINQQNNKITVLENRMNTFTSLPSGSTTGDAELIDIRVPANGFNGNKPYANAGDAVRGQVSSLKEDLAELFSVDVTWIENKFVRPNDGTLGDFPEQKDTKYWASEKIEVSQFCKMSFTFAGGSNLVGCAFYDKNDNYIKGFGNGVAGNKISLDVPPNAKYFRYTKETKSEIGSKSDYTLYMTLVDDLGNQFALLNNITIKMKDDKISGITDFNTIESGTIYKVLKNKTPEQIANAPFYPYKGLIITLNATREVENVKLQIATNDMNRIFMRSMWTTWGNWIEVKDYSNNEPVEYGNLLTMYDNMTFIGDSLTWSQVYLTIEPKETRQAYRPYPKIVAELSGAKYEILANPGDTSQQAWNRWNSSIVNKVNNINIVYLGTNGGLTDTITSDCPSSGNIDDYADTNTGCYGKFLKKIYDLNQKAILIKIYDTGGDLEVTNNVIEQFGERFNFPVVDAIELGTMYRLCPIETDRTGGVHYNDLGYSVFANRLIYEVNNMSDDMKRRLIPVK